MKMLNHRQHAGAAVAESEEFVHEKVGTVSINAVWVLGPRLIRGPVELVDIERRIVAQRVPDRCQRISAEFLSRDDWIGNLPGMIRSSPGAEIEFGPLTRFEGEPGQAG